MQCCRWPAMAMVFLAVLAAQGARAEDRALLVGVGKHERQLPFRDLPGIDRDLAIMQQVARELGFEDGQIRVLADEEATLEGIRSTFESWLIDSVAPGERALFYFSGHGYHVPDGNDDEPDGRDEILVPHDYAGRVEALTNVLVDDEIEAWLDSLRTEDVLVFLDACHSGSAVRGSDGPVAWSLFDGDPVGKAPTRSSGGGSVGYLALSAARDTEQAQATRNGSTFTVGIGRAAREAAGSAAPLTMNGILDAAEAEIARAHPDSMFHPVLSGDVARADDELRRRSLSPAGSLWERLVAATAATSRRLDVSGVLPTYHAGERMTLEVVMPVDGYLSVVAVVEGADEATVLYPWTRRSTRFAQGDLVRVPDPDSEFGFDLEVELEDPTRRSERKLLVVVASENELDLDDGIESVVPLLDGFYRAGLLYVVSR